MSNSSLARVTAYLEQHQKRFVRELCDYIRFPSVSAQPQHRTDMEACARWLQKHCTSIGLEARICPTGGHPAVIARTTRRPSSRKPHFVVYGHYDVQPAEPFELWRTPPFEPCVEGRILRGRGACDNKGQHFAHLKAVEAYLRTGSDLPCDLTFLIEGEEEVGSDHLSGFLKQHRKALRCEAVVVSDNGIPDVDQPALTYALRGIVACEVHVQGPARDLHSGLYGGSVDNPAMVLCQLLARLRDDHGRITVPGFYDDVVELTPRERRELHRLTFDAKAYAKFLGTPALFGEQGYSPDEQRFARPTCEINGLTSGYQGAGSKTIIPAKASAKLTFRLVPNQDPDKSFRQIERHLRRLCPPTVKLVVERGHGGEPYLVSPDSAHAKAALRALRTAFGAEPLLIREGGSIPIVSDFKRILGVDTLLLGLALPDDNPHSPNEKFSLVAFERGMRMAAVLWQELAAL